MDLTQLNYLVKAIELSSISEAAKSFGVSQPAVTKGIRALEKELGTVLLERHRQGVRPTTLGDSYYRHARAILTQAARGTAEIARLKGQGPVTLSIGSTPSFMGYLLPTTLARLTAAWPHIQVNVQKALYGELMALLQHREIDVAFAIDIERRAFPQIESVALVRAETAFFINPNHALAGASLVSLDQLAASRWILLDSPDVEKYFENLFGDHGLEAPKPVIRSTSMRLIKHTVRQGDLVGFLPSYMVADELESGALRRVEFKERPPDATAKMFYRDEGSARPEVMSLLEIAKAVVRENEGKGDTSPSDQLVAPNRS